MTTKRHVLARRQRNQALAQRDARNRCADCKVSLIGRPAVQIVGQGDRWCADCYRIRTGDEAHEGEPS